MDFDCDLPTADHEIERLKEDCKRLDKDGDKWMNRAAVAEAKLDRIKDEAIYGFEHSRTHTKTCNARTALEIIIELLDGKLK